MENHNGSVWASVLLVGSRMFHSISKLRNKDAEANHGSSFPVFQSPARNFHFSNMKLWFSQKILGFEDCRYTTFHLAVYWFPFGPSFWDSSSSCCFPFTSTSCWKILLGGAGSFKICSSIPVDTDCSVENRPKKMCSVTSPLLNHDGIISLQKKSHVFIIFSPLFSMIFNNILPLIMVG